MEKVVIVGGGGFAKCIINYVENDEKLQIVGYTDMHDNGEILGYKWIGTDNILPQLLRQGVKYAVIGVGLRLNDSALKRKMTEYVLAQGFKIPIIYGQNVVVHRGAIIEEGVVLRDGCIIQAGTIVKAHAMIGDNVFIAHDSVIGEYAHVVAMSNVGRDCVIGEGTMIGTACTLLNGVKIGKGVLIGAKSLVNRDCLENGKTYLGHPVKLYERKNG